MKIYIVGQSIIGREDFIEKVLDRYLNKAPDLREQPSLRKLHGLRAKEETDKGLEEIKKAKGIERIVLMDLLYRAGGLKGAEIGRLLDVDYSTVSQGRKRLRDKLRKDRRIGIFQK